MSLTSRMIKMPLKFAANLSFMFKEHESLLDRYSAAKEAGFEGVECAFPYDFPLDEVVAAKEKAGLQQVLINGWPGNLSKGDLGIAAQPGREGEFLSSLSTSIKYAKGLDCKRIHIMSGKCSSVIKDVAMDDVYQENLNEAVEQFSKEDIVGLIEPINRYSVPNYYLNNFDTALNIIKKVNSPHLKLQMDIFHLQFVTGNLTNRIKDMLPYVGHIQIAQVPDRHEPNTFGEINYKYIFELLEKLGYDGWIGCEYNPKGKTTEGLTWVQELGVKL